MWHGVVVSHASTTSTIAINIGYALPGGLVMRKKNSLEPETELLPYTEGRRIGLTVIEFFLF